MITRTSKVRQYGGYLAAGTIGGFVLVLVAQYEIVNKTPPDIRPVGMVLCFVTAAVLGGLWDRWWVKDDGYEKGGWLISAFFVFLSLGGFHLLGWLEDREIFLILLIN